MLRNYAYVKALNKRAKKLKKHNISLLAHESFQGFKHNMLIEEEMYIKEKDNMPYPNMQEYSILEKVDLIDYGNDYGRNKKRRSLLCRS